MSITRSVTITCDICGTIHDETGYFTSRTAVEFAREDGWKRRRLNGATIDICDQCIEKEQASL